MVLAELRASIGRLAGPVSYPAVNLPAPGCPPAASITRGAHTHRNPRNGGRAEDALLFRVFGRYKRNCSRERARARRADKSYRVQSHNG